MMVALQIVTQPCAPNDAENLPGVVTPCGMYSPCVDTGSTTGDGLIRPFDETQSYVAFQAVTYDGALYIAKDDISPGPFDINEWTKYSTEPAPTVEKVAYTAQWTQNFAGGEYLFAMPLVAAATLPANLTGSKSAVLADAQVDAQIAIIKNATQIGTITFTASVASYNMPETTFVVGDTLVLQSITGAVFKYLSISLVGTQAT